MKNYHQHFIKYIINNFSEFYSHPPKPSKLFPHPYFAMIIILNNLKENNNNIYDYLYKIINNISTDNEIKNFVYPLIHKDYFNIKYAVHIIETLICIHNNNKYISNNKPSIRTYYVLKNKIEQIINMIYFWITKYQNNDKIIKTVEKHFVIPQNFICDTIEIDVKFDFKSLISLFPEQENSI